MRRLCWPSVRNPRPDLLDCAALPRQGPGQDAVPQVQQSGFSASIRLIFHAREYRLIDVSRWIATAMSACTSYQTSRVQLYLRVNAEPSPEPRTMLTDTVDEIGRDAGIERSIAEIGHHVDRDRIEPRHANLPHGSNVSQPHSGVTLG